MVSITPIMKKLSLFSLISILFIACAPEASVENEIMETPIDDREFYQLKVYTFDNEQQVQTTDQYLKNYYLPQLKKKGIQNVGVFKTILSEKDSIRKTYVLIPYSSLQEWFTVEQEFIMADDQMLTNNAYQQASHESPAYQRIESTIMRAFPDMPQMKSSALKGPRDQRIYELRSYESPTEEYYKRKVDMFNAGGEVKLFDRLGFNAVFYADVLAGADMPNLIYMTTFPDRATRDSLWKEFVDAPEWKAIVDLPKYTNTVSHADVLLLRPTDYSDY